MLTTGEHSARSFLSSIVLMGLISRLAVLALGATMVREDATLEARQFLTNDAQTNAEVATKPRLVRAWYRWDAIWYIRNSRDGYRPGPSPGRPDQTQAFMPMLSSIMWAGSSLGLDRYWVGLLVANLAFVVGLTLFGLVALRVTGDQAMAWRACLLMTVYPWAFYFSAPYNESLSLALCMTSLLAWLVRRPVVAGISLGFATACRLTASAMSAGVVLEWIDDKFHHRPARASAWPVAIFGMSGALVFLGYLYFRFGDPMLHLKAHQLEPWLRGTPSLANLGRALFAPPTSLAQQKDYAAMMLFLALGMKAWYKRGPLWGCLILMPILQAMSSGTVMSISRVTLAAAPAFIDLAELLRNRFVFIAWVIANVAFQVILIRHFVNMGS